MVLGDDGDLPYEFIGFLKIRVKKYIFFENTCRIQKIDGQTRQRFCSYHPSKKYKNSFVRVH